MAESILSQEIKKAIVPVAGLGTRFLPLSKSVPKELWPIVDNPMVYYAVDEACQAGIKEIIFVISAEKKPVLEFFKESLKLEKFLKENKKTQALEEIKAYYDRFRDLTFSFVYQKKPLGDGHAVLQAEDMVNGEPCAMLFSDDIIDNPVPCLTQLLKVFKTCQRTVVAIKKIPDEELPSYGVFGVEKIANRLYKIKSIIEKPKIEEAPSNLVHVGRSILIPETFDYLKRAKSVKGENRLVGAWEEMINDGKPVYGYEFEGEWLECGNKLAWLKSHLYLSLKHPQYGPELRKYLKEMKIS